MLFMILAKKQWTKKKIIVPKGQVILKWFLGSSISFKKRTNEFVFTSMRHVFVRFLGESLARKKHFEIIWPLSTIYEKRKTNMDFELFFKVPCHFIFVIFDDHEMHLLVYLHLAIFNIIWSCRGLSKTCLE